MSTRERSSSGGGRGKQQSHPHDLISYRDTGELSDLTVVIDGEHELQLHKFPLYIKCDYFRDRAGESRVELGDFPGGRECFDRVADFCYGKRIDIGPENCVQLNCAARRLGMTGRDNLVDLTGRYLDEVLRSAQLSRSMGPVVDLLVRAAALDEGGADEGDGEGEVEGEGKDEGNAVDRDGDAPEGEEGGDVGGKAAAAPAGAPAAKAPASVAERCFAVLLDAWTRPGLGVGVGVGGVGLVGERLLRLPLDWFARLIKAAGSGGNADSDRQRRALAELATRYLHRVFVRDADLEKKAAAASAAAAAAAEKSDGAAADDQGAEDKAGSDAEADGEQEQQQRKRREDEEAKEFEQFEPKEPAGEVLDRVVLSLPEATPLAEVISADWIQRALRISEKFGCECRGRLLQLAGNTLHRFRQDELHQMPSPVLCDIVSSSVRNKGVQPEVLSCVIDNHLLDLARAGSLDADDFVKLAASVPAEYRASHDALYEVAETLLSAGDSIPDEKQKEVIDTVDLSRCDVSTLQRALDKGVIPMKMVCQSAIDVAKKLRQQQQQQQSEHIGRTSPTFRFRDETRIGGSSSSSSRFPIGGGRRYDSLGLRQQQHHFGSSGGTVHYTDPYAAPLASHYDEDRGGYSAHDFDVDLLLLEAERNSAQRPPVDYHLAGRRTRKW